jgi:type I restriction enzyme M protein
MRFEEFAAEIAWWGNEKDNFKTRVENEYAWKVSVEEIVNRNYNLDISNPHVGEQISHDPEVLLANYKSEQQKIGDLRNQLKAILAKALTNKGK